MICFENAHIRLEIGDNGQVLRFADQETGTDRSEHGPISRLRKGGKTCDSSSAAQEGNLLVVAFEEAEVEVRLKVDVFTRYLVFEVDSTTGKGIEELALLDIAVTLPLGPDDPVACCVIALNLKTNVVALPKAANELTAVCVPRFGLVGAKAALVTCPPDELRETLKEVVLASPELPASAIGGAWAVESEANYGSYLFNFDGLRAEDADEWIALARSLGVTQIDFHGGASFRFGDCRPDPKVYPRGFADMRAVNDHLHEAGILAGLHTYAFFIDKSCPWVSPVPDPRLAKDVTFTLASDLGPDDSEVIVQESTQEMSNITGFFVRNSVTLQIDDELVTYEGISRDPPYAFTGCNRGACGTRRASHTRLSKVHHLKECFGLFVPDGDSSLLEEVAAATAQAFNKGSFDMIYFDALDGEDVLGGRENGWHYGSKFVYEVWKRLERPAIAEMSTFHHHIWHVRSRMGAWDHPNRGHKRFVDIHSKANEECKRVFLPTQLGWWAFKTWHGPEIEPTFEDVIEYLCCKAVAGGSGLSIMGIDPKSAKESPALPRLAKIMREYEEARREGFFSEAMKLEMGRPGSEFILGRRKGGWAIRPVNYSTQKVQSRDMWSSRWLAENPFGSQAPWMRIEALLSVEPYDSPKGIVLWDLLEGRGKAETANASIEAGVEGEVSGNEGSTYWARNSDGGREGAWARISRTFDPPLDLGSRRGMGVWILGDGKGEVLNFQLRSPEHICNAITENYVVVDFTGWRYFGLVEPEGGRFEEYRWPYSGRYAVYRESVKYECVESLGVWYNNLPPGSVACGIRPVRALPVVPNVIRNPALMVGGQEITFPVEISSGSYIEFTPPSEGKVFGPTGELVEEFSPEGSITLANGTNEVSLATSKGQLAPRCRVTLRTQGKSLK